MINFILGSLVKNNIIERSELENYHYALEILFLKIIHYITILIISLFFNILPETFIFLYVYSSIRTYIGGYHSKNMYICLLLSFLFIVCLNFWLQYKEIFDGKVIILLIFIGLYYFYRHCDNFFLNKIKINIVFIVILSISLLILKQNGYLISIAYAIILNFFLFKFS